MPKILTVNVSDASGGAARAAYRIHKAVNSIGECSTLLVKHKTLTDDTVLAVDIFDKKNILSNITRFVVHKIKNKLQQASWNRYPDKEDVFMSDLRSISIHGALRKIDFDILHLHWINLRFLDLRELTKVHKPIVWTLHDCWPFTGICHYFYDCHRFKSSCGNCPFLHSGNEHDLSTEVWRKKQQLYKNLNLHIVTPSNWLANAARESSLFGKFSVSVIPNPINTGYYLPGDKITACKRLNFTPDKMYILFGAMNALKDKNKGYKEFLLAMQYFESQFGINDTELIVFGANEEISDTGLKIKIHNIGLLDDEKLLAVYQIADIMVVPSLSENLSNIIMESLSCGVPVVAFNIGGNSDLVEHKRNGYLAENPADMANGIKWCLDNNTTNMLSGNARNKVLQNYSSEVVASQYIELYQSLVK